MMEGVCEGGENSREAGAIRTGSSGEGIDAAFEKRVVEKVKKKWETALQTDEGWDACRKPGAEPLSTCGGEVL